MSHSALIVGGGLAGLFCALRLAPRPVILLTSGRLGQCALPEWEQGGIAEAVAACADPEAFARGAVEAGAGLVERPVALGTAREAGERLRDLLALGAAAGLGGSAGDLTARAMMDALVQAVRRSPSIHVVEHLTAEALIEGEAGFVGVRARGEAGFAPRATLLPAGAIVLATGGVGQLYGCAGCAGAIGLGIALATGVGAVIGDAEFVQFRTAPAGPASGSAAPTPSYHLGGVRADESGRTNAPYLWAIGQCAATGLHGAGPASNALIEALVFADRVAGDLRNLPDAAAPDVAEPFDAHPERPLTRRDLEEHLPALQAFMARAVGPVREAAGLRNAVTSLARLRTEADGLLMEHAATAALMIAAAALARRESRGVHRRNDHPEPDPKAARRRSMRLEEALAIAERVSAD